jgi:hypothetical protein
MEFKYMLSVFGNLKFGINQIDEMELFRGLFHISHLKSYRNEVKMDPA